MPNDDLISRKNTIAEIKRAYCTGCNNYNGIKCRACNFSDSIDIIEDAPSVDAEPVRHATWEKGICCGFVGCSECHDVFINSDWLHDGKWKYCPNCGAKM